MPRSGCGGNRFRTRLTSDSNRRPREIFSRSNGKFSGQKAREKRVANFSKCSRGSMILKDALERSLTRLIESHPKVRRRYESRNREDPFRTHVRLSGSVRSCFDFSLELESTSNTVSECQTRSSRFLQDDLANTLIEQRRVVRLGNKTHFAHVTRHADQQITGSQAISPRLFGDFLRHVTHRV